MSGPHDYLLLAQVAFLCCRRWPVAAAHSACKRPPISAASSRAQSVFPDAEVTSEVNRSNRVVISACPEGTKQVVEVANVAQRDLYAKYGWPAKTTIIERLEMFKESFE